MVEIDKWDAIRFEEATALLMPRTADIWDHEIEPDNRIIENLRCFLKKSFIIRMAHIVLLRGSSSVADSYFLIQINNFSLCGGIVLKEAFVPIISSGEFPWIFEVYCCEFSSSISQLSLHKPAHFFCDFHF